MPATLTSSTPLSFDDPVPSDSVILGDTVMMPVVRPHSVERQVQRKLLAQPKLQFSSLVVRRLPDGVCIEGVMTAEEDFDVCSLARQVAGVEKVVNRLLVRCAESAAN